MRRDQVVRERPLAFIRLGLFKLFNPLYNCASVYHNCLSHIVSACQGNSAWPFSLLTELITALGDEQGNIRWLAASALMRIGGLAVVKMLAAFLATEPGAAARQEAVKVLGLIADTDKDEAARQAAQALTNKK
ncbi:MAG: hypothetical protein KJ069_16005 [Anaerolineae bacterium]|nr:hypothetical protein [Anaerolineae bacterium]